MSEQVKRYSFGEFAEQHTHPVRPGSYVKASDYDALHAEAEALRAENAKLRTALVEQGERQEAVARVGMVPGTDFKSLDFFKTDLQELPVGTMLYTTPQPIQDVRALVEALEVSVDYLDSNTLNSIASGSTCHRKMRNALAAHRQAQRQGDSHE